MKRDKRTCEYPVIHNLIQRSMLSPPGILSCTRMLFVLRESDGVSQGYSEKRTCRFHWASRKKERCRSGRSRRKGFEDAVPDSSSEPAMERTDPVRVRFEIAVFGENTASFFHVVPGEKPSLCSGIGGRHYLRHARSAHGGRGTVRPRRVECL